MTSFDYIIIGAGSAGCAVAAGLAEREAGRVLVLEAGPSDVSWRVRVPMALIWLMGSRKRDWRYHSTPQAALGGRRISIPRGRMLGGSSSINSMVWFRGCAADFDDWQVPGWMWADVEPAFEAIEQVMQPTRLATPHPLTRSLGGLFGANAPQSPTPERESAGVFRFNLHKGRRFSAADGFLRPAMPKGVEVRTGVQIDRLAFTGDRACGVILQDGTRLESSKGVVLSAGSIGSPDILLRSGIGPAEDLRAAGIDVRLDRQEIGQNLHDHPSVGLHFTGDGYGLTMKQLPAWLTSPFQWMVSGKGRLASPTVEGGMFFRSDAALTQPDLQSHFIPFRMDHRGRRYVYGDGFFADVTLCRPQSRGALRMTSQGLDIDPGLFRHVDDVAPMVQGITQLRTLLREAGLVQGHVQESWPGETVRDEEDIEHYVRQHVGTAYHPVGTLRMGTDHAAPVSPELKLKGVDGLWVADASIMPCLTSANTNAPSIMIGHRAAGMILY